MLTRMRVSEPCADVAEVVALLAHGGTTVAVALRLERRAGAWTCMVIQVI
jgi:pseudouridine-5'-phosphate glycosidase